MAQDNPPFGSVIVMLGTAAYGPLFEPVNVVSPDHALSVFGDEGTLYSGYLVAYTANPGATYYLVRINGRHAKLGVELYDTDGDPCYFELKSGSAGSEGNNISVYVEENILVISDGENECIYDLNVYRSLGELVEKINRDATVGLCPLTASVAFPDIPSSVLTDAISGVTNLSGGTDNLMMTKNELYEALDYAYNRLEGYRTDIVIPLGVYFDDVLPSYVYGEPESIYGFSWYSDVDDYLNLDTDTGRATFHGQLIDFCRRQTARGLPAHGVLGFRPLPDYVKFITDEHIAALMTITCLNMRHGFKDNDGDFGHYISLVLGDLEYDGGYYQAAPVYAAVLAAAGTETTTNTPVLGFERQRAEPTNEALRLASKAGIVMFYNSLKNGLSVYNGVTAAPHYRPLHYIANVRTGQYLIYMIYLLSDSYIGSTQGIIPVRDAIERSIEEMLASCQRSGIIRNYSFKVSTEYLGSFSYAVTVDLSFTPKYSIEEISTSVTFGLS